MSGFMACSIYKCLAMSIHYYVEFVYSVNLPAQRKWDDLALPLANTYLASDFSLVEKNEDMMQDTVFPELVEESDTHKLWYKPDHFFNSSVGEIS